MSEYEVFGKNSYANSSEQNFQAQYEFFKNGNSKIFYSDEQDVHWWLHSAQFSNDYVKKKISTGAWIKSSKVDAEGVAIFSELYSLPNKPPIENKPVANIKEIDSAAMLSASFLKRTASLPNFGNTKNASSLTANMKKFSPMKIPTCNLL